MTASTMSYLSSISHNNFRWRYIAEIENYNCIYQNCVIICIANSLFFDKLEISLYAKIPDTEELRDLYNIIYNKIDIEHRDNEFFDRLVPSLNLLNFSQILILAYNLNRSLAKCTSSPLNLRALKIFSNQVKDCVCYLLTIRLLILNLDIERQEWMHFVGEKLMEAITMSSIVSSQMNNRNLIMATELSASILKQFENQIKNSNLALSNINFTSKHFFVSFPGLSVCSEPPHRCHSCLSSIEEKSKKIYGYTFKQASDTKKLKLTIVEFTRFTTNFVVLNSDATQIDLVDELRYKITSRDKILNRPKSRLSRLSTKKDTSINNLILDARRKLKPANNVINIDYSQVTNN